MLASSLLTIAAATLATALPAGVEPIAAPGQFEITKFTYGCTIGCDWSLNIAIHPDIQPTHPSVPNGVACSGNVDDDKSYKECAQVSNNAKLYAFIGKVDGLLRLRYEVTDSASQNVYNYYGEKAVYPQTGPHADWQKPEFNVTEISGTKSKTA